MNKEDDKEAYEIFSIEESSQAIFEKIKDWEIDSKIKFAVFFKNPTRIELLSKVYESETNETIRRNIQLIKQRIENAAFYSLEFTHQEIEHYQNLFAQDFYAVLHSDNYTIYIQDKIRELLFYCEGLEIELRKPNYEFSEDIEHIKAKLIEAERYKLYLENLCSLINKPVPDQVETNTEKLKVKLGQYGFNNLSMVSSLSQQNKERLFELINTNSLPYKIAMLNYLGFLDCLQTEYFPYKSNMYKFLEDILNANLRAIKGNINALSPRSAERKRKRYTAHNHIKTVEQDYKNLN